MSCIIFFTIIFDSVFWKLSLCYMAICLSIYLYDYYFLFIYFCLSKYAEKEMKTSVEVITLICDLLKLLYVFICLQKDDPNHS